MKASELRCPECNKGAVDVAPDFEIERRMSISWTCLNGHRFMSGYPNPNKPWEWKTEPVRTKAEG